jgi:BMFP domain-containing protein YqiC
MQSQNKIFDDLAKVVSGAAGTVAGMAREAEAATRERAREWVGGLDMVSREEFEVQKDLLTAARAEIDALKAQVDTLTGGAAKPARKPKS